MSQSRPSLVQEVHSKLLEQISIGKYKDLGGRLPSEVALSDQFGVSRPTIREAIARLVEDGVLTRRHGVGTFIHSTPVTGLRSWPYEKSTFLQLIRRAGHEPAQEVLRCVIEPLGPLADIFNMRPDDISLSMEKLFYSDEQPVIFCRNVIPVALVLPEWRGEVVVDYSCEQSIYTFVKTKCGRQVESHESEIKAQVCDSHLAQVLAAEPGSPVLQLEEVAFDKTLKPLFYGLSYLRSDLVSFRIRRGLSIDVAPVRNAVDGY
jgi:GntR family transcriptional regulator